MSGTILTGVAGRVLAGVVVAVFFLVVVIGGGVYRTDCIATDGHTISVWDVEGNVPYLWSPDDSRCQAHALGRYVAGKVGLMSDVDESTLGTAFTPSLIRQVGAGSMAEARLIPTLQSAVKNQRLFSEPTTSQATVYLLEGQLNKLTEADLQLIAAAVRSAQTALPHLRTALEQLQANISAVTVSAASNKTLSNGSRSFIRLWDRYLNLSAGVLHEGAAAFGSFVPVYDAFPGLLQAARDTARLKSAVQYDRVRRAVFALYTPRLRQLQAVMAADSDATKLYRKFVAFVNRNRQAQAIVTQVNHDYPAGLLAQEFKSAS